MARPRVPKPAGFPNCGTCPLRISGPAKTCASCAGAVIKQVAPAGAGACGVCSQLVTPGGVCRNSLCRSSARRIDRIHAISYDTQPLGRVIRVQKYRSGRSGWDRIFGRLLLGWLDTNFWDVVDTDIIVANPTWPGTPGRRADHTEAVIEQAHIADVGAFWPFDISSPRVLTKTGPTPQSAGQGLAGKQAAAQALGGVLQINDPAAISGKRVLVYDDICTTGSQLNAVAAYLLDVGGAARVEAVVLARVPW